MSDVDLCYLMAFHDEYPQEIIDYYLQVTPYTLKKAAVNISKQYTKSGVFPASIYSELSEWNKLFPSENTFVINDNGVHSYSPQSITCYYQLFNILRKKKYDVIHFTWPFKFPGMILYALKNKMVMTVHDPFPHSSENNRFHRFIRSIAFGSVSHFILLNQAQREDFIHHYRLENKHVYVSSLSAYTYLRGYLSGAKNNCRYVLFFGQVTPHKGLAYFFKAAEEVHRIFPDVKFVVAGKWKKGYTEPELHNPPEYLNIFNRFIPDGELADLIAGSLFVVTPYLDATQSGVVMSSFALSKPCIATNVGGLSEMVINEKCGLIRPPKDAHAIAETCIRLISNPSLCENLAQNITNDYLKGEKSWLHIAHEHMNTYKSILTLQ